MPFQPLPSLPVPPLSPFESNPFESVCWRHQRKDHRVNRGESFEFCFQRSAAIRGSDVFDNVRHVEPRCFVRPQDLEHLHFLESSWLLFGELCEEPVHPSLVHRAGDKVCELICEAPPTECLVNEELGVVFDEKTLVILFHFELGPFNLQKFGRRLGCNCSCLDSVLEAKLMNTCASKSRFRAADKVLSDWSAPAMLSKKALNAASSMGCPGWPWAKP